MLILFRSRSPPCVLIAWTLMILFCAKVSSSPVSPTTAHPAEESEASAEDENQYDLESSGTEEVAPDSARSRRHDGEPKYCQLFCRVGLFLEMDENGRIRGTGKNGSRSARLFEVTAMPDEDNEVITIKNQGTKKFIAIDNNGGLFATESELLETRFIRRKNIGAYQTLQALTTDKTTPKFLGMDKDGHCKILPEKSDETDILFLDTSYHQSESERLQRKKKKEES